MVSPESMVKDQQKHRHITARLLMALLLSLLLISGLTACGSRTARQTWEEGFDTSGTWDLSSDAAAEVTIQDSQLHIHILQAGQVAWTSAGHNYTDFNLQVEATQVTGPANNEYGVLARMDENERFYVFSISGDGYARVARYEAGAWELLSADWFPHEAIHQGTATNTLELEVQGSQFTFHVNGEEITTVKDETLIKGDIGLYAGAFSEPDVHIAFDNLQVSP